MQRDVISHGITWGVGVLFKFETRTGRKGAGAVKAISSESWRSHAPVFVEWYDESGKHYEWFNTLEFRSIVPLDRLSVKDGRYFEEGNTDA